MHEKCNTRWAITSGGNCMKLNFICKYIFKGNLSSYRKDFFPRLNSKTWSWELWNSARSMLINFATHTYLLILQDLSAFAQKWAEHLAASNSFQHSDCMHKGDRLGENIACKWSSSGGDYSGKIHYHQFYIRYLMWNHILKFVVSWFYRSSSPKIFTSSRNYEIQY